MNTRSIVSAAALGLLVASWTQAMAADNLDGRNWAATCTGCHGTNGNSEGGMPVLAGLEKGYIVTTMQEFKAGKRQATVMHQHAKGYTDEQIERIAEFLSAQKRD